MPDDNPLPDMVWYFGTPFEGTKANFFGQRKDDGRTYTYIWTQEALARQFATKYTSTNNSVECASLDLVMSVLICCGVQWVVIDAPQGVDDPMDDSSLKKLNCQRSGDMWPYIETFWRNLGGQSADVNIVKEFAKENPDLPPLELFANFAALIGERTESLNSLKENCKTYAEAINKDPEQVTRAVLITGFPPHPCSKCGEKMWLFEDLSPNAVSSNWTCQHCGKKIIIKAQISENHQEGPARQSISKAVQREVWQRDRGQCVECGSKENLEFDHIIPVSKGGASTTRNIQLLCEPCNRGKGDKDPGEW